MFRQILSLQWKSSRMTTLVGVFAAFALPILSVRTWSPAEGRVIDIQEQLIAIQQWGVAYPTLAAVLGFILAMTAWGADHRGKHIYALTLPVPRWYYVLLKLGAGAVLLAAPIVALWFGSILATTTAAIPTGLDGYAGALTLRFALASLIAYAGFFAISAGTNRIAGYVLGVLAGVIATQILIDAAGFDVNIIEHIVVWLFNPPSPFEIFGGRWVLIDV